MATSPNWRGSVGFPCWRIVFSSPSLSLTEAPVAVVEYNLEEGFLENLVVLVLVLVCAVGLKENAHTVLIATSVDIITSLFIIPDSFSNT